MVFLAARWSKCSERQRVYAMMVVAVLCAAISTGSSFDNNNSDDANQDVVAFTISKEETGSQNVMATLGNGGQVACEFSYKFACVCF